MCLIGDREKRWDVTLKKKKNHQPFSVMRKTEKLVTQKIENENRQEL